MKQKLSTTKEDVWTTIKANFELAKTNTTLKLTTQMEVKYKDEGYNERREIKEM